MELESYIPQTPAIPLLLDLEDAQRVRRDHLSREASVRSVGTLYCLGGLILMVLPFTGFFTSARLPLALQMGIALAFCCIGILQFWTGTGLRKLNERARKPTAILSGLGLIGFPIGTAINAYILYLVFSPKGAMVFSPAYRQVISDTPEIKYRTSVVVWVLLGLLVLLLGLVALSVMQSK